MALNIRCLEILAEWWACQTELPQAVPIQLVRTEVGSGNKPQSFDPSSKVYIYICVCYIQYKHKILIYQYINIYIHNKYLLVLAFSLGSIACVQTDFQVILWQELCGLPRDQGVVASDSWGLKRLLSYGIRRGLAGARAPREPGARS